MEHTQISLIGIDIGTGSDVNTANPSGMVLDCGF